MQTSAYMFTVYYILYTIYCKLYTVYSLVNMIFRIVLYCLTINICIQYTKYISIQKAVFYASISIQKAVFYASISIQKAWRTPVCDLIKALPTIVFFDSRGHNSLQCLLSFVNNNQICSYTALVATIQCDQIWRNFATLPKHLKKTLANSI